MNETDVVFDHELIGRETSELVPGDRFKINLRGALWLCTEILPMRHGYPEFGDWGVMAKSERSGMWKTVSFKEHPRVYVLERREQS